MNVTGKEVLTNYNKNNPQAISFPSKQIVSHHQQLVPTLKQQQSIVSNMSMDDFDSIYTTNSNDCTMLPSYSMSSSTETTTIRCHKRTDIRRMKSRFGCFWFRQQLAHPSSSSSTTRTTTIYWTREKKLIVLVLCFVVAMMFITTLLTSIAFKTLHDKEKQKRWIGNDNMYYLSPSPTGTPTHANLSLSITPTITTTTLFYTTGTPTTLPSTIPSKNPSTRPSMVPYPMPSFVPTSYPTRQPSLYPSTIPTTISPTISQTYSPSVLPTKSSTDTQTQVLTTKAFTLTNHSNILTFNVISLSSTENGLLLWNKRFVDNLSNNSSFVIHLGNLINRDISLLLQSNQRKPSCHLQQYKNAASILQSSPVPVFVLPGNHTDWNDCSNPNDGFIYWNKVFGKFETMYWKHDTTMMKIVHPPHNPMNFVFQCKNVLWIGLDLFLKNRNNVQELRDMAYWTTNLIHRYQMTSSNMTIFPRNGKRVILLSHLEPTSDYNVFFQYIRKFILNELNNTIPLYYIHGTTGNGNSNISYEWNFLDQPSFTRIIVPSDNLQNKIHINLDRNVTNPKDILFLR